MARSSPQTIDLTTGVWSSAPQDTNATDSSSNGENLTTTNADKDSSTGGVEKKYNDIEINTLTGELSFIVTEETIKLQVGDTIKLKGIGKHLSGDYYIKCITRQISSNGYSHSATLIKTDFGKTLKVKSDSKEQTNEKPVNSSPEANNPQRTYTVKKGDTLWKIAKEFYGDGSQYSKIYDANTNKIADPNLIYVGQVFVIT